MEQIIRRIDLRDAGLEDIQAVLCQEWLSTNGLGGYASGTISGAVTRRYHGLLIAALPAPLGRVVMLNHLAEFVRLENGRVVQISGEDPSSMAEAALGSHYLKEFRLENRIPVWRFEVEDVVLEKQLLLLHGQNTVHISYRLSSQAKNIQLQLRPSVHFRNHEGAVDEPLQNDYKLSVHENQYEILQRKTLPPLRMTILAGKGSFNRHDEVMREAVYHIEADRGYESRGKLWSPGHFSIDLQPDKPATFVASTEPWDEIHALSPEQAFAADLERRKRLLCMAHPAARNGLAAELVLAADQFVVLPATRTLETTRAKVAGDEARTIIAGYHWFTDWGRDTMISLEGLGLVTGRHEEAGCILRTFAHHVRDGLIPNFFPDGDNEGVYHTADATLWFFHALDRYLETTNDRATFEMILPMLRTILDHHLRGTKFGIRMDATDGLLMQGAEGYQLTWMDAKVDGWVVTPRRGKAVEINALWYNALRLMENWMRDAADNSAAQSLGERADQVYESFNEKFWNEDTGHLFDVIDGENGNDPACRPNQLMAISLRHAVLEKRHWKPVLSVVKEKLLTPVGLRSLSPDHPDYKPKYFGDLRARDAAYHQGTVWAWLIGPFVDAWLKAHPKDRAGARKWLDGFTHHMNEACIGSISEIFDAERPFKARGCIAQAWSVAEVLRCLVKTADESTLAQ